MVLKSLPTDPFCCRWLVDSGTTPLVAGQDSGEELAQGLFRQVNDSSGR